eukprot:Nk52_evm89s914 gene=Nk52_evmTU89s914
MANRTVKDAGSVHGTNPQFLIEKILRGRIYESLYWKEHCFALNIATVLEKAVDITHVGGTFGAYIKPTPFLCLQLKLLQLLPERDIVLEILNDHTFKYVRCMMALFVRLTWPSLDVYKHLEPILRDYRKVRIKLGDGNYILSHVDEFIDELLREDRVCGIMLPRLKSRDILEEEGLLEPRNRFLAQDGVGEGECLRERNCESEASGDSEGTASQYKGYSKKGDFSSAVQANKRKQSLSPRGRSGSPIESANRSNSRSRSPAERGRRRREYSRSHSPAERIRRKREYSRSRSPSERGRRRRGYSRSRSPAEQGRRRREYSRSRSPAERGRRRRDYSRSRSPAERGRRRREYSRSRSPAERGRRRSDYSRSRSPAEQGRRRRDYSRSRSPAERGRRRREYSRSRSPAERGRRRREYSRSRSPTERGIRRNECSGSRPSSAKEKDFHEGERKEKSEFRLQFKGSKLSGKRVKDNRKSEEGKVSQASNGSHEDGKSIEEWNEVRAKLGLKPLDTSSNRSERAVSTKRPAKLNTREGDTDERQRKVRRAEAERSKTESFQSRGSKTGGVIECSVSEWNAIRAKLGLKPLKE